MCGGFERKEKWYLRIGKKKDNIYTHDTAITNDPVHQWSLKIKIYMIYL